MHLQTIRSLTFITMTKRNATSFTWTQIRFMPRQRSERFPVGSFRFLTESEIKNFDLASVEKNAEMGFILECDLSYPSHLHDSHNDYPSAPEHVIVTHDMLSPFAESLVDLTRPWTASKKIGSKFDG